MRPLALYLIAPLLTLMACTGEDRSGEQPFVPEVRTVSATPVGSTCTLVGHVLSSPNSTLKACGFVVMSDSATRRYTSPDTTIHFTALIDSLTAGQYAVVAFATNGVGTATATDTLTFTILP